MNYHEKRKAWLPTLKEGDTVCVHNRYHGYMTQRIVRITPTGLIKTDRGATFRNGHSKEYGWLYEHDDIAKDDIRRRRIIRKMTIYKFEDLSTKDLLKIEQLIDEIEEGVSDE